MDNQKIRIVMIEDNDEYCQSVLNTFEEDGSFEVVGLARDGKTGLEWILNQEVDVALIEIVLPVMDGLYVLEELKNGPEKKPVCIMLSDMSLDSVTRRALQLGADYFIVKPFDTKLMVKRVKEIYEFKNQSGLSYLSHAFPLAKTTESTEKNPEAFVSGILHNIPIFTHLKGYMYLKNAIYMSINDVKMLSSITKVLYPSVAQACQTTPTRVERAIRHAIETAWSKGYGPNYFKLIGFPNHNGPKPTNSQFISAMAELYNSKSQE